MGDPRADAAIDQQRQVLTAADARNLLAHVAHAPQVVGDAFTISKTIDLLARNVVEFAAVAGASAADPLMMASLLGLWDLANGGRQA